jgi:hypothetical protein
MTLQMMLGVDFRKVLEDQRVRGPVDGRSLV